MREEWTQRAKWGHLIWQCFGQPPRVRTRLGRMQSETTSRIAWVQATSSFITGDWRVGGKEPFAHERLRVCFWVNVRVHVHVRVRVVRKCPYLWCALYAGTRLQVSPPPRPLSWHHLHRDCVTRQGRASWIGTRQERASWIGTQQGRASWIVTQQGRVSWIQYTLSRLCGCD